MSQLTIYLDEETMTEVKAAARRDHVSVSQWARVRLKRFASEAWPEDYFSVFGSLKDKHLARPEQPNPSDDLPRSAL